MKKTLIILLLMSIPARAYGQSVAASEDDLKAAYIFHFINFTQWDDNREDYYVCVPDDEPLKEALETTLKDKVINNRNIVVLHQAEFCHVLVSDDPPYSKSMLTIGPLEKGALLEFRLIDNKLKFAIDLDRIRKSRLKISSQLLKLAILENS